MLAEDVKELCTLVSYDLEATGLQVYVDEITEIGAESAVLFKDGTFQLLQQFETRVRCTRAISAKAQKITGISIEVLVDAPKVIPALKLFEKYIEEACTVEEAPRILVAYNGTKFDVPMCVAELERGGVSATKFMRQLRFTYLLDPVLMAREVVDTTLLPRDKHGKPCFKLGGVYEALCGIPLLGAHGALADSSAVLKLLLEQSCFRDALIKDCQASKPKYLANLMTLVTDVVSKIPKQVAAKQADSKKLKTLLHFFTPLTNNTETDVARESVYSPLSFLTCTAIELSSSTSSPSASSPSASSPSALSLLFNKDASPENCDPCGPHITSHSGLSKLSHVVASSSSSSSPSDTSVEDSTSSHGGCKDSTSSHGGCSEHICSHSSSRPCSESDS